jgi:hypothetical protein
MSGDLLFPFGHIALKMTTIRFSEILTNQPTNMWCHHARMEMRLATNTAKT